MSALDLTLHCARLSGRTILHPLNLLVTKGELVALIGPNGAGKTTLLRAIAGLIPFDGTLTLDGRDAAKLSAQNRARAMAYLPQAGQIHWPLRVRDVVGLGRLPFGHAGRALSDQNKAHVERVLQACCLEHLADRSADELSGGEKARVLLARALAVDAPVLLADEPVAALDPALQLATLQILADQAAQGRAIVVVMHDLGLALRFATRFVALVKGHVVADGVPDTLVRDGKLNPIFGLDFVHTQHESLPLLAPRVRRT